MNFSWRLESAAGRRRLVLPFGIQAIDRRARRAA
jgi:hypothetical protein